MQALARIAKAQADSRALASAISIYSAHMGTPANALTDLTAVATNGQGQTAGPFMAHIPTPPTGWPSTYSYVGSTAAGSSDLAYKSIQVAPYRAISDGRDGGDEGSPLPWDAPLKSGVTKPARHFRQQGTGSI